MVNGKGLFNKGANQSSIFKQTALQYPNLHALQSCDCCIVVTAVGLWLLQSCDCCRLVTAAEFWLLQGFDCCRAKCRPRPFCLSCARLWPTFTFYGVADLLSVSSFIPKISLQCTSPWNTQPWPKPSPFQKTVLLKLKQIKLKCH